MSRKSSIASRTPGLFQRTGEGLPPNVETANQPDVQLVERSNVQASERPDGERSKRTKVTYYLPPEDVVLLDQLRQAVFLKTGKRTELSVLVSRAIRLLGDQPDS